MVSQKQKIKLTKVSSIVIIFHTFKMIEDFSVNYSVLHRGTDGAIISAVEIMKGAGTMITMSDLFQFVMMLCAVITLVVYILRKK